LNGVIEIRAHAFLEIAVLRTRDLGRDSERAAGGEQARSVWITTFTPRPGPESLDGQFAASEQPSSVPKSERRSGHHTSWREGWRAQANQRFAPITIDVAAVTVDHSSCRTKEIRRWITNRPKKSTIIAAVFLVLLR
jgi:hypothetical protein